MLAWTKLHKIDNNQAPRCPLPGKKSIGLTRKNLQQTAIFITIACEQCTFCCWKTFGQLICRMLIDEGLSLKRENASKPAINMSNNLALKRPFLSR